VFFRIFWKSIYIFIYISLIINTNTFYLKN
jgi:hypothetical protein